MPRRRSTFLLASSICRLGIKPLRPASVSYTHLDVYKRQAPSRGGHPAMSFRCLVCRKGAKSAKQGQIVQTGIFWRFSCPAGYLNPRLCTSGPKFVLTRPSQIVMVDPVRLQIVISTNSMPSSRRSRVASRAFQTRCSTQASPILRYSLLQKPPGKTAHQVRPITTAKLVLPHRYQLARSVATADENARAKPCLLYTSRCV